MVNSKENSKHGDRSETAAKWFNPETRWTLLYIGNRGKPITLKRFKGMVLSTLLVICVAIVLAAGVLFWNRNIMGEKNQLEIQLKKLADQNQELRHERDILLTRLVVAESRALHNQESMPENRAEEETPAQKEQDIKHPAPFVMTTAETGDQNHFKVQPDSAPPTSGLSVAIEKFKLSFKSAKNSLRVQFKLKNTSPDSQHVSGHAIVVLKGEGIEQTQWVALPGLPLVAGKPTGRQHGNAFGISNYKMMRFSTGKPSFPEKFQTASVYVFTQSGELLLEQDFPVNLSR